MFLLASFLNISRDCLRRRPLLDPSKSDLKDKKNKHTTTASTPVAGKSWAKKLIHKDEQNPKWLNKVIHALESMKQYEKVNTRVEFKVQALKLEVEDLSKGAEASIEKATSVLKQAEGIVNNVEVKDSSGEVLKKDDTNI